MVPTPPSTPKASWRDILGLNASTGSLLLAILLVTSATELWSPVVPEIIKAGGGSTGLTTAQKVQQVSTGAAWAILLIAAYGSLRDFMEAINYFAGGWIAGRFNSRRALLLFNILPLIGLGLLAVWPTWWAAILSVPFLFVWDSISGPATLTVVGDSLSPQRRTMAFSLQAIFRRVARLLSYSLSGLLLWLGGLGWMDADNPLVGGFRTAVGLAIVVVLAALVVQYRLMKTEAQDRDTALRLNLLSTLRQFDPQLRRLLWADIAARWAEGLPRELIIVFCVGEIMAGGLALNQATALYPAVLLNLQAVTNVICYLIVGPWASHRPGLAKKPFIGLTFVFFALFPLAVAFSSVLGWWGWGGIGLIWAFVVGGIREIGEPARKAMITELVPTEFRTQAIGIYWGIRSLAVFFAPVVGGLVWITLGPIWMLILAGVVGLIGAATFFLRFGGSSTTPR